MADNDLELHIRTTADLAALKQVAAAEDDLAARTVRFNRAQMEADTARFAARTGLPLPGTPGLSAFGAGAGGAGTQGLTTVAADMDRVGTASLLVGANLARARNEATTLVREMAAGAPTTRTWGALLGALGFQITGIAAALGAVPLITYKIIEHEQQINSEIDKQLVKLTDLTQKWREAARGAETAEDVSKLATPALSAIDEVAAKLRDLQNEGPSLWGKIFDIKGVVEPFQNMWQAAVDRGAEQVAEMTKQASGAVKAGIAFQKTFEADRFKPIDDVLARIRLNIRGWEIDQAKLDLTTEGSIKQWVEMQGRISAAKKELTDLIKLQEESLKIADASAKKLAKDVQTPQAEFQKKQQEEYKQHMDERHALQIKSNAARASGDRATADAIDEQLRKDTFRRDQAQEAGERQLQLNRDIYSTPEGEYDQYSTPIGMPDQYDLPESALPGIYSQKASERQQTTGGRTDAGSEKIAQKLDLIYRQWQ